MKRTKIISAGLFVALLFVSTIGCAKWKNKVARDGGFFTSHAADYIVISQSGGIIMDVWKLENVMVQSEEEPDGWLFRDQEGNVINIGGDSKVIRLKKGTKSSFWSKYYEYHMEFEKQTYREKFSSEN